MAIYKRRLLDNEIIKFNDNETPAVPLDFDDATQGEIDNYELGQLKQRYVASRKKYLNDTLYHHHRVLDGIDNEIADVTVASKRTQAHNEIDVIEGTIDLATFYSLGYIEDFF